AADVDLFVIFPGRIHLMITTGKRDQKANFRMTRPGEPDGRVFDFGIRVETCAAGATAVVNHDHEFAVRRKNALDDRVITVSVLHWIATSNDECEENEKKD